MKSAHIRGVGEQLLLSGSTCTCTDASKSHSDTCIAADMPMRVTDYILLHYWQEFNLLIVLQFAKPPD